MELSGGFGHLMVADIDAATKYVSHRPYSGETAQAARNLTQRSYHRHGVSFTSEPFREVCEGLLIKIKPVGVGQAPGQTAWSKERAVP